MWLTGVWYMTLLVFIGAVFKAGVEFSTFVSVPWSVRIDVHFVIRGCSHGSVWQTPKKSMEVSENLSFIEY